MKIYTKKGDKGQTSLLGGLRVSKADLRIECYGTVDELNSNIGLLRSFWENKEDNQFLELVQNQLFNIGSILAKGPSKTEIKLPEIQESDILNIEKEIDRLESYLEPLKSFVLPSGSTASSQSHISRCVCRRAERLCVALEQESEVDDQLIAYLNRLSDYLFVLSRKILSDQNIPDHPWSYL